ncbi:RNA cap guanine-N2 methyltransferase-domain-containing protein [Collybia nuda]|uniref:Trimethylguanosine synthase n=1 Tax=Collybia nuda TaxID=64659 RepID=A0A9P5XWI0_9AGAR|nr:RNA cap guanine-N2 methyltransferase-domain-containing protein [Collybia nuda]
MGKRKGGLTGLSRFVLEAFKNDSASQPTSDPNQPKASEPLDKPENRDENRPTKRRKTQKDGNEKTDMDDEAWSSQWVEKYDATGLVPHYTNASEVPDHLKKYFSQRNRYFSLYSTPPGCLLDEEGWYSITPELVADQIAERCRCDTILDAFCGVGGNAIAFAKTCQRVIALDTSPTRLSLARHNAQIYGVADRIEFVLSDYISFAKSYLSLPSSGPHAPATRRIDVVFLSPPWGGPSYISGTVEPETPSPTKNYGDVTLTGSDVDSQPLETHPPYSLSSIQPIHGAELFRLSRRITQNIAYYLPRNTRLEEISDLLESEFTDASSAPGTADFLSSKEKSSIPTEKRKEPEKEESVEVEEEWMGTKLKALTCYFGGLVGGQEDLF